MRIETMLNHVQKFKSFVYKKVTLTSYLGRQALMVMVVPRTNSKPLCSRCGRTGSTYDHLGMRRFEFVPLWNLPVYFCYQMRRVICS